jgi:hypothetical protein
VGMGYRSACPRILMAVLTSTNCDQLAGGIGYFVP